VKLTRAAVCSALVWLCACGSGESTPPRSTETSPAPAATAAREPERVAPALEPGAARLRYENGHVTLEANAAPVQPLLERLATQAHFELQLEPADWPPLTASFDDLALAEALPRLIGNRSYTTRWRASAGDAGPLLVLLRVGEEVVGDAKAADAKVRKTPSQSAPGDKVKTTGIAGAVAGQLARALHEHPEQAETQEELLEKVHDSSAQVRREAALELRPEGEGLHALSALLANDPDPDVRTAATTSLEVSDDPAAVQALVAGLSDPDPAVVVEVLDSLEFAADEKVIPHITPLLQHPDATVREAAQDAIDFLGD
jgi:HEAT repeat protein